MRHIIYYFGNKQFKRRVKDLTINKNFCSVLFFFSKQHHEHRNEIQYKLNQSRNYNIRILINHIKFLIINTFKVIRRKGDNMLEYHHTYLKYSSHGVVVFLFILLSIHLLNCTQNRVNVTVIIRVIDLIYNTK